MRVSGKRLARLQLKGCAEKIIIICRNYAHFIILCGIFMEFDSDVDKSAGGGQLREKHNKPWIMPSFRTRTADKVCVSNSRADLCLRRRRAFIE
ncbi:hypothetical protein CR492_10770 [Methylocella silvestris]|uniref:Uncharacterized protein n=1 Tax=Methylocella silvestris TaxID=199596 RepID=A0A2J7TH14_METSI|nr:hypothetical protein CR492_10770 [Methylocella silvestris]